MPSILVTGFSVLNLSVADIVDAMPERQTPERDIAGQTMKPTEESKTQTESPCGEAPALTPGFGALTADIGALKAGNCDLKSLPAEKS